MIIIVVQDNVIQAVLSGRHEEVLTISLDTESSEWGDVRIDPTESPKKLHSILRGIFMDQEESAS